MKPIICIPSYKRPSGIAIKRLRDIPLKKFLFVRSEELDIYREIAHENNFTLVKLKNVNDLGDTRQKICEWCNYKGFDWVFMFDDDISKVELLSKQGEKITSSRILYEPEESPRFEYAALEIWYKIAKKYNLSLSSPNHRAYDRFEHGYLQINCSPCIQCTLLHIPDVISVGNYKTKEKIGNEDYYIQYKLMSQKFLCGKIGIIEYDCPSVGINKGGCYEDYVANPTQEKYVNLFLDNVCNDPKYVTTKTTKTQRKSVKFIWKNWNGKKIKLKFKG